MKRALALLAALAVASTAEAQSPSPSALAEALFRQARDLMDANKIAEACPKLAESQRLDPRLVTLLNLALCHEKEGKIATALGEFSTGAMQASRDNDAKREELARSHIKSLRDQVASLVIQVADLAPGLTIDIDGTVLDAAVIGTPLPLDPGIHTIHANAPGKRPWSAQIEVPKTKGNVPVIVPPFDDEPQVAPPPPPPPPPKLAPPPPPPPVEAPKRADYRWLAYTGFGVGGAGLLVGAIAGGVALSKAKPIKDACGAGQCASQKDALSTANTLANVSNVGFAFAGAGVITAIVGLALQPREPGSDSALTPLVGPDGLGLAGRF